MYFSCLFSNQILLLSFVFRSKPDECLLPDFPGVCCLVLCYPDEFIHFSVFVILLDPRYLLSSFDILRTLFIAFYVSFCFIDCTWLKQELKKTLPSYIQNTNNLVWHSAHQIIIIVGGRPTLPPSHTRTHTHACTLEWKTKTRTLECRNTVQNWKIFHVNPLSVLNSLL